MRQERKVKSCGGKQGESVVNASTRADNNPKGRSLEGEKRGVAVRKAGVSAPRFSPRFSLSSLVPAFQVIITIDWNPPPVPGLEYVLREPQLIGLPLLRGTAKHGVVPFHRAEFGSHTCCSDLSYCTEN